MCARASDLGAAPAMPAVCVPGRAAFAALSSQATCPGCPRPGRGEEGPRLGHGSHTPHPLSAWPPSPTPSPPPPTHSVFPPPVGGLPSHPARLWSREGLSVLTPMFKKRKLERAESTSQAAAAILQMRTPRQAMPTIEGCLRRGGEVCGVGLGLKSSLLWWGTHRCQLDAGEEIRPEVRSRSEAQFSHVTGKQW